jgi:hypothetical protein
MGIDAEILVRKVKASVVTDVWLKELSWRLCESIGVEHFFVSASPEYGDNAPRLAIDRTLNRYREENTPPPGSEYHEDSYTPVKAEPGECLLELSLSGRYYGPGYERGNILVYCAIAEWLEHNIPGCEVWYGGDSSGVLAEPFNEAKRVELRKHLYGEEGREYFRHSGMGKAPLLPPACALCPHGRYWGSQCMWGGHINGKPNTTTAGFHCPGCGKSTETRDGGQTWQERKRD